MENINYGEVLKKLKLVVGEPEEQKSYIVYAKVATVGPVTLSVEGYNFTIPSDLIVLGALCRRYVLPIPHKHIGCENPTTGNEIEEIEVWRGLEIGDRVVCLRMNSGQLYYVLQRAEMEGFR